MPEALFLKKGLQQACNFIKKETLGQVFSCEFCESFKNIFFTERLRTTAFAKLFWTKSSLHASVLTLF